MYLAKLTINNFRKLAKVEICFQPGLNIIVGPNNVGKTAVIDGLRALLSGHDELLPRLSIDDIYRSKSGTSAAAIEFHYLFDGLDADDEADFLSALVPNANGDLEAHIHLRYSDLDKTSGRLRVKRWCGQLEENALSSEMMENLRGVYLPPLRDASLGLRPSRASQLARLVRILADEAGRLGIDEALKALDTELRTHPPLIDIQSAISGQHKEMLGVQLAQAIEVGLSASDFHRFSSRLSLIVDSFEIEQNGLGFNNLIFMAVVLSELAKNPEAAYRGLIVEEPEAHLHPQLQAVLLRYLQSIKAAKKGQDLTDATKEEKVDTHEEVPAESEGQKASASAIWEETPQSDAHPPTDMQEAEPEADPGAAASSDQPVQVFATSHSPNFASIAKLASLVCLVETENGVNCFLPGSVAFGKGKREKLERYLDVTRAEIFFARRIIFVEGAAELMLVSVLARKCGYNLRDHAVSLISVEGLNFDCFLPLFGRDNIRIRVAVITDADPTQEVNGKIVGVYPKMGEPVKVSDNTSAMLKLKDDFVGVFHGVKTLEYDLALFESNRIAMLKALKKLHPKIGEEVAKAVNETSDDADKAKALFCGMFERNCNNVQKGRFGQALAQDLLDANTKCDLPDYIKKAIEHVCGDGKT
jgi:putative ATP-dependent endonuclease of OLD family